jgi:hypothetical protein
MPLNTPTQRLRSAYLRLWFEVSERLRWSRGVCRETLAGALDGLDAATRERIERLALRFATRFEAGLGRSTALDNYAYLDLLDRAFTTLCIDPPRGGRVQDAGSASFRYAAALQSFFAPRALVGVEVEGYRLLRDGHSRIDRARGYVAALPHARFVVADYARFSDTADTVTMFFPFVTVRPLLAWRLPLKVFDPGAWFARAAANLTCGGLLVVVSHGDIEADIAARLCSGAGLTALGRYRDDAPLQPRPLPAVVTLWRQ